MKKTTLLIIVIAALALVAVALFLTRSDTTFRKSLSGFAVEDTATICRIYMSDKNNNDILLERSDSGFWVLNGKYRAQVFNINMLLQTIHDIEVKEPVAKKARNNIIRMMASDAVKVEIYKKGEGISIFGIKLFAKEKQIRVFYVGGATPNNRGSYFLMEGSDEPFVVFLPELRGFVSSRFSPIEKYWRDYTVFRMTLPQIARVRVEIPESPEYSFEVINNQSKSFSLISLSAGKPVERFDTLRVMNFLTGFRNLNFEALLNDMDPLRKDSIISSQPFIILTVTDTLGVVRSIRTFHKKGFENVTDDQGRPLPWDPDRLYALVNDGQDFVLIQYFVFNKVLRPLPFFLGDGMFSGRKQTP